MQNQAKIKAVIWDMGGVLLRTEDGSARIRLAEELGRSPRELNAVVFGSESAQLAEVGTITTAQHWENVAQILGLDEAALQHFKQEFWAGDEIDRGLIDYIHTLRPRYRTGLLSNAWSNARADLGGMYNFIETFDVSVFSAEVKMAKPDERFYRWILERLEVAPHESVFIDDFLVNIEAAAALGLHTIHFQGRDQALQSLEALLQAETN